MSLRDIDPVGYEAYRMLLDLIYNEGATEGDHYKLKDQVNAYIESLIKEKQVALLAKIANTEAWEESAWVYCTEPEIGMSPNEFEEIRHNYPNLLNREEDT